MLNYYFILLLASSFAWAQTSSAHESLLAEMMNTKSYALKSGDPRNTSGCPVKLTPSAGVDSEGVVQLFFSNENVFSEMFSQVNINVSIAGRGLVVTEPDGTTDFTGYLKESTISSRDEVQAYGKKLVKLKFNAAYLFVSVLSRSFQRTVENTEFQFRALRTDSDVLMDLKFVDKVKKIESNVTCAYEAQGLRHQ